jgi:hypothetical protein
MIATDVDVAVGNYGMANVYLVFEEDINGYRTYYDYYYLESEALDLVIRVYWRNLKVETMEFNTFMRVKDAIRFQYRNLDEGNVYA